MKIDKIRQVHCQQTIESSRILNCDHLKFNLSFRINLNTIFIKMMSYKNKFSKLLQYELNKL